MMSRSVLLLVLLMQTITSIATVFGQPPKIRGISLINTKTKQNLGSIQNGTIIDISKVGDHLTLQAYTAAPIITQQLLSTIGKTRSVVFDINDNERIQIENFVPYTLAGDQGYGNTYYRSNEIIRLGNHTILVTPYSKKNGTGIVGSTYIIQFTTIASSIFDIIPIATPAPAPLPAPLPTPVVSQQEYCACPSCTEDAWNTLADGISCGERITWVMNNVGKSEIEACVRVSLEFPDICGVPCNSNTCNGTGPKHCGCNTCTDDVWNAMADNISCGQRISWVVTNLGKSETDACIQLSNEFPNICGVGCNSATCNNIPIASPISVPSSPTTTTESQHCECTSCTDAIWNQIADEFTCGERITWVMKNLGKSETDACIQVSTEFPTICGVGCNSGTCSAPATPVIPPPQSSPILAVIPVVATAPQQLPPVIPLPPLGILPTITSVENKCGGAVNTGETSTAICTRDLWNPTGDPTQHCYAYGGVSDPCAVHNNNDINHGLDKSPAACLGDTFYLWDEPDTQGKNYTWAGVEWAKYATRFSSEIQTLRARGVQFTSPLLKAGEPGAIASYLNSFYTACGPACHDPQSSAYININAINAFAGPWNSPGIEGCRDGATFITNELISYNQNNDVGRRPWYVTNWSRLGTDKVSDQVDAINAIDNFFASGSPVRRIYWFGAIDYGGNSSNNYLTTQYVNTTNGVTTTLGKLWKAKCDTL